MLQEKKIVNGNKVNHQEYIWYSEDKNPVYAQCWSPDCKIKACILLIHEYGEYGSRYSEWANMFCEKDIAVLALDLRGHGNHEKSKGENNYHKLLLDVELLINRGRELFPNSPLFLYGQGLGGNLACRLCTIKTLDISGIITTSPLFQLVNYPSPFLLKITKFFGFLAPNVRVKKWVKAEYMSKELKEVHLYRSNPTILRSISAKLLLKIIETGKQIKASMYKINKPILVIHGNANKIASCQGSRDFTINAGVFTSYVEIEGGFHELHSDREKMEVFEIILKWLQNQIS